MLTKHGKTVNLQTFRREHSSPDFEGPFRPSCQLSKSSTREKNQVQQDVARYVMLRIPPLVHLCQICIYLNTHYQKMP